MSLSEWKKYFLNKNIAKKYADIFSSRELLVYVRIADVKKYYILVSFYKGEKCIFLMNHLF